MVLTVYFLVCIFIWTGMAVKFVVPPCDQQTFDRKVDNCLSEFNKSMEAIGYQDTCPWPAGKSTYNDLKHCVDDWAKKSWCKGHRFLVDEVFLEVHQMYFYLCGQVRDPPLDTLILLIAPVIVAALCLPLVFINLTTYNTEMAGTLGL